MNATEVYNPFFSVWKFTQQYFTIIRYELSNDNAKAYYSQGRQSHRDAIAQLKEFTLEGWENHAQYCIAVFGPSVLMAIAVYQMWQTRNRLLPPVEPKQPIAFFAPVVQTDPVVDTSWIDWKAYLELLLKQGRLS